MAFLASSMRIMNTSVAGAGSVGRGRVVGPAGPRGGPLTPVSDNERMIEKFTPWAFKDDGTDRVPSARHRHIYQPPPEDVEILLRTYWTSIHPVCYLSTTSITKCSYYTHP